MYKSEYAELLEEQKSSATGARLEQLNKQGEGEKKLCEEIIGPVLKTFKGIVLEKEIVTLSGVKVYIDAYYEPLRFGFEGEGFVVHAENITRSRFDFERQKIRSMVAYGIKYIPFSWDEMDKKADACRRTVYELVGRYSGHTGTSYQEVSLYEREVIRYALRLGRPIKMSDVRECLQSSNDFCHGVLKNMLVNKWIRPLNETAERHHQYVLSEEASKHLW
ncbi:hypothetical protein [Cohnella abietis]|uniref:Uncharacterized protein n=1 Tax=Cohnella abietis TaxID=2507935 RepID=A0A3T1D5G3_9BACL|nr:hypothetical protein [Cohnella abietis]BBI33205.1 hypothetical protein KCTCHS21_26040 [Cohnella abietis]